MYYAVNLIPIIFGNKKTVEFRIHTPTYDISKIMLFIMMQSSVINFTIRNSQRILQDPRFLKNRNLHSIFSDEMINLKNVSNSKKSLFLEEMDNYIFRRKQFIEHSNFDGKIAPDEDDLKFSSMIDYESGKNYNIVKKPMYQGKKSILQKMPSFNTNYNTFELKFTTSSLNDGTVVFNKTTDKIDHGSLPPADNMESGKVVSNDYYPPSIQMVDNSIVDAAEEHVRLSAERINELRDVLQKELDEMKAKDSFSW
jgi:hypothetical protein